MGGREGGREGGEGKDDLKTGISNTPPSQPSPDSHDRARDNTLSARLQYPRSLGGGASEGKALKAPSPREPAWGRG